MPLRRALHLYILLVAICGAGFWVMDDVTNPATSRAQTKAHTELTSESPDSDAQGMPPDHPGEPRLFMLMVDSLRYETAIDPQQMPRLLAMQPRGVYAEVKTAYDAITVPALEAMATGKDRIAIWGVVDNFWHRAEDFRSLFSQAAESGRSTAIWSDGSFRQFEDSVDKMSFNRVGTDDNREVAQDAAVDEALRAYLRGEYDFVIAHITYSDYIAHEVGIYHSEYKRVYERVDQLIERLDAAIPAEDGFVVIGDHGHDEIGRHQMGMDVPTYAFYRGAAYAKGVDLGTIPIMDSRFLMSWALEIPLAADYAAGRHPTALRASGAIPPAFAGAFDYMSVLESQATGVQEGRRFHFWLAMIGLCGLITMWLAHVRASQPLEILGVWPVIGLLVASVSWWWAMPLVVLVVAVLLWRLRQRVGNAWTLGPLCCMLGFVGWGYALSVARPLVHYPDYVLLVGMWALVIVAMAVATWRWGVVRPIGILGLLACVLAYPSVYRYGAPAALAPVWFVSLSAVLLEHHRYHRSSGHWLWPTILLGVFLLPFAMVNSVHFEFSSWFGPIGKALWGPPRAAAAPIAGVVLALAAKLIIFIRPQHGPRVMTIAVAAVALLFLFQSNLLPPPTHATRWLYLAILLAVLAAALAVSWSGQSREVRRIVWVLVLLLAFRYLIRANQPAYLWMDCFLAAIVISGWILKARFPTLPANYARLLLLVMGCVATGWCTLTWTFHGLEWGLLYDWFDASFVENQVAAFLPLIVFRACLPLIAVCILVNEAFTSETQLQEPPNAALVIGAVGLKTFSLMLMASGVGLHRVLSDVYLEAVQQTVIWAFLVPPLFWAGRRTARAK